MADRSRLTAPLPAPARDGWPGQRSQRHRAARARPL